MDRKVLMAVLTSGVAVALAVRSYRTIRVDEVQKRKEIDRNMHLDLQAIRIAADKISEAIDNGEIRSISQLGERLQTEIAFQKITIREN